MLSNNQSNSKFRSHCYHSSLTENVTGNSPFTLVSSRFKPAFAALGFIEVVHLIKIRIGKRRKDSLRDPIIRLDPERMAIGIR